QELIDIFHKWELHAVVAGEVITDPIVRILHEGKVAAEIPAAALAENTPLYEREILSEPPEYAQTAWQWDSSSLPSCDAEGIQNQTWSQILLQLLATPSLASKAWVYRQYDHQVQNNTVLLPGGGDAAVVRVRPQTESVETYKGVAATTDCNGRYVYLDPYAGAKLAVAEAARNLSCVGAEPVAITDNLNFGSPEKPIGYWQLAKACEGIAEACRELDTPVTGGNVSLYNETLDHQGNPQPIYPTPVIGMVGFVPDVRKVCGQGWRNTGDLVYLLGSETVTLGGSDYLATVHETVAGKPPYLDVALEKQVQFVCREGIQQGLIHSAHDCAEGGVAVALAESCLSGSLGVSVTLSPNENQRWDECLFGEGASRILVSVSPDNQEAWETFLQQNLGTSWQYLGVVQGTDLKINNTVVVSLEEMKQGYESAIAQSIQ
ncbi:MAG: AIR synthase related protein, partial [Halothece sp. Uz-M2-17]|nr:AIR synthase related protein [Halothece sp. Uz-M2-17]